MPDLRLFLFVPAGVPADGRTTGGDKTQLQPPNPEISPVFGPLRGPKPPEIPPSHSNNPPEPTDQHTDANRPHCPRKHHTDHVKPNFV